MTRYMATLLSQLEVKTDAELQAQVCEWIARSQFHLENDRPFLSAGCTRKVLIAQGIQASRVVL
jgi:hypothetical protein